MKCKINWKHSMIPGEWFEAKDARLVYPNGMLAREVWKNLEAGTGQIFRYDMTGKLIMKRTFHLASGLPI